MKNEDCPFCNLDRDVILESEYCYTIFDKYPVNPGHVLVISKRHEGDYFNLAKEEVEDLWQLVAKVKHFLEEEYHPDGFNVGFNVGSDAGQTIDHVHIHVIPRFKGDMDDPTGGVRHVIPGKGNYKREHIVYIKAITRKRRETLAGHMDNLIERGGSWVYLEHEGNRHAIRMGFKTRCTPGIYRAHIKYRQIKDPNYLGKRRITDNGIF